jgi:hypothetical protein
MRLTFPWFTSATNSSCHLNVDGKAYNQLVKELRPIKNCLTLALDRPAGGGLMQAGLAAVWNSSYLRHNAKSWLVTRLSHGHLRKREDRP